MMVPMVTPWVRTRIHSCAMSPDAVPSAEWDDCSDTPVRFRGPFSWSVSVILMCPQFLYNPERETVVSYDDTFSLESKAKFAKESGMAGCFTWSLDQVRGSSMIPK